MLLSAIVALTVTAAPAIEDAIPASARSALFIHEVRSELEPAVDALERILDPFEAQSFIETAPLPAIALEMLESGENQGLDLSGGLALFRPDGFSVAIGVAPVTNGQAALAAVEASFARNGIHAAEKLANGMQRYRLADGLDVLAYVKGAFIYLVMPDTDAKLSSDDILRAASVALLSKEPALSKSAVYERLRARVARKGVQLFAAAPLGRDSAVDAALLAATFDEKGTYVDGFVATSSEVLHATSGSPPALLAHAPAGPSFILSAKVLSNELSKWVGGDELSIGDRMSALGLAPSMLAAALTGDGQVAFYADPELLVLDALSEKFSMGPLGTVLLEAKVADPKLAEGIGGAWLKARGAAFKRTSDKDGVRLRALINDQPVELRVRKTDLKLEAGPRLRGRKSVDVVAPHKALLPPGAFGPGHVSAVLDLAQVRRDLELNSGSGDEEWDAYSRLFARMLEQLTSVERVAVDLGPEVGGARISGTLLYGPLPPGPASLDLE